MNPITQRALVTGLAVISAEPAPTVGTYHLLTLTDPARWESLQNCTPHALSIQMGSGNRVGIMPSGVCPRVEMESSLLYVLGGIAVHRTTPGEVIDLPSPQEGVWLIVSRMIVAACPERLDLLSPGGLIRNSEGRVIGCDGLSR